MDERSHKLPLRFSHTTVSATVRPWPTNNVRDAKYPSRNEQAASNSEPERMSGAYSSHWSTYRFANNSNSGHSEIIVKINDKHRKTRTYLWCLNIVLAIEAGNKCSTCNVPENCVDTMYKIPVQNHDRFTETLQNTIQKYCYISQIKLFCLTHNVLTDVSAINTIFSNQEYSDEEIKIRANLQS